MTASGCDGPTNPKVKKVKKRPTLWAWAKAFLGVGHRHALAQRVGHFCFQEVC